VCKNVNNAKYFSKINQSVYFCIMKKSEQTRQIIIKKSAGVFNQKGFAGTSMSDIMEVTGLTKGGLYGNFKNKNEIAKAAFDYAVDFIWEEIGRRTNAIDNSLDKLKAVVYFYKEHLFNPPVKGGCPILKTGAMLENLPLEMRAGVKKAITDWERAIVKTLEKGKEKNEVRKEVNSEDFATLFLAILEGGMLLGRTLESIEPFKKTTRQLVLMIDELKPVKL